MKIAFVTPQFVVGGAEIYILRKSKWLIEHGHKSNCNFMRWRFY